MVELVSMPALKSKPPFEPTRPNTTTIPPLSLYSPQALIPSKNTNAIFNHPQLINLVAPPVVKHSFQKYWKPKKEPKYHDIDLLWG